MISARFIKEKETKNTIRFQEVADQEGYVHIGALYLQKESVAEMGEPEEIMVEIRPIVEE